MDKATPESAPANAEGVMAIAFELARIREEHGAQSGMYLSEVRALRAEVERLAAQAAPSEEMSPEFTDTARAALLWVLWHHQGGSSKVGQPIRFALGMGQHQPLSNYQVREAQRWEAMAPTRDAANVPPGEWNSEPEGLTPKQAWWAGYRVGKGLPPDMPRSEAVAAQPSQAPVVQAGEYPPLPEPTGQVVTLDMVDGRKARVIRAIDPHWMVGADGKTLFTEEQMRAYVDADRASSGATTAQAVYVPRLLTALEICRQYPDFDADTAIGTMLDAAIKGEPNEMLDLVSPHTGAAQAVRMLITEFNVGRFCLSEDDCIAQGIDFSAYERGVADAAEAFSRNA